MRALLFDLDGTLIDSRRDIAEALNHALEFHGRKRIALEAVLPMVGDGSRKLVARAFGKDESEVDAELESFRVYYMDHPADFTTVLPGARESLALGLPCGIITNKPKDITLLVLEKLGLPSGAVWGAGDGPLKPDPAGIRAICRRLGVPPEESWMIGDGPQDILAGRAAGCFTVAVPGIARDSHLVETKPDLILRSLAELVGHVTARRV